MFPPPGNKCMWAFPPGRRRDLSRDAGSGRKVGAQRRTMVRANAARWFVSCHRARDPTGGSAYCSQTACSPARWHTDNGGQIIYSLENRQEYQENKPNRSSRVDFWEWSVPLEEINVSKSKNKLPETTSSGPFLLLVYLRTSEVKAWETQEQREKRSQKRRIICLISVIGLHRDRKWCRYTQETSWWRR